MNTDLYHVSVYRFNPEVDKKPYMKNYQVKASDCKGVMVLDLLEAIKQHHDPTLSFRRSCGEGVCGSDGMNINGKNGLACITPLSDLEGKVIKLRPLLSFPVVRDLIVDLSQFYKQYESVQPYLQNDTMPAKENVQSYEERKVLDGLYECILCACCTSSCPSSWWNMDKFLGPSALLWACRFIMDSRDTETMARLEDLQGLYRLFRCRGVGMCRDVCPKGLNPTQAIHDIREKMLRDAV